MTNVSEWKCIDCGKSPPEVATVPLMKGDYVRTRCHGCYREYRRVLHRNGKAPDPKKPKALEPDVSKLLRYASQPRPTADLLDDLNCSPRSLKALLNEARREGIEVFEIEGDKIQARRPPLRMNPREPSVLVDARMKDIEIKALKEEKKRLLDELILSEQRNKIVDGVMGPFKPPPIRRREVASGQREATAVMLLSDWHVEEPVSPEKVNGLNEFDLAIADYRLDRAISGLLWMLELYRKKIQIKELVLWFGGDHFSGHIHEDLAESNSLSPIESILWLLVRMTKIIDTTLASTDLDRIYVACNNGNHGRTTDKIRVQTRNENSYEWLLFKILASQYAHEPRVVFDIAGGELLYVPIYETLVRFTHGDATKYQGGVGGLTIPLNKAIDAWNDGYKADLTCLGHWHSYMAMPHFVVNGSLIGYAPYSVRIKARYEVPRQAFFLIDSKHGKCCDTPIWLDEARKPTDPTKVLEDLDSE